ETKKTTLYIFMTPTILSEDNFSDARELSSGKQGEVYDSTSGTWVGRRDFDEIVPGPLETFQFVKYEEEQKQPEKKR
ncbi:MAG: hypothetical protein RDV41_14105, partial [Planctomycetota bacterium]|nr:hypothetical protein [Planctomycetota bacterium]